jgi:glycosyltransferase involved in cell wall biosynthesis
MLKMTITYAITVCDEMNEFDQLLSNIIEQMSQDDEILIIKDKSKGDELEFEKICYKHLQNTNIQHYFKVINLNNNFADFKNNIVKFATKDFIVQIDADELMCPNFVTNLKQIIELNPTIDCYTVARENFVTDIPIEYLKQMSWTIDEQSRINFPDRQFRIFKNNGKIFWKNSVHEVLYGWRIVSNLPEQLFLIHRKSIEKQLSQNEFYDKHF